MLYKIYTQRFTPWTFVPVFFLKVIFKTDKKNKIFKNYKNKKYVYQSNYQLRLK